MLEAGSLQPSGRVIAGGRLLLAILFLIAIWSDSSQPTRFPAETYGVLLAYVSWAFALTLLTWRDWWLDARLAVLAHLVDWARNMRISLNVLNATNDRQEVRDTSGGTPLRYQPGYRDPLGRTIELELRKVF